jgi:hypothetical protein
MSKPDKNELRYWFTDGYSKFVESNQNKKKLTQSTRLVKSIKFCVLFTGLQAAVFLGLYLWYFFSKINYLPLISIGTLVLPLIASIIFISFYLYIRNQFKNHLISQNQSNATTSINSPAEESKKSFDLSIFNSETKIWRGVLITFAGYLVAQIGLFIANQTKLIQHDSLLNLILPILIVIIMPVIATLITTFKEFLDNITVDFSRNINENNGQFTYKVEIPNNDSNPSDGWFSKKLNTFTNGIKSFYATEDQEFVDTVKQILELNTHSNQKNSNQKLEI